MKKQLFILTILLLALQTGLTGQSKWKFDKPHTSIQFTVANMGISEVSGRFTKFNGTVTAKTEDFENASILITIDAASINTDNEKRDNHLRSEDFLHVEKYPEIKFESTSFEQVKQDEYKLIGQLSIRGVTRKEEFKVKYKGRIDSRGQQKAVFKLSGTINRFDYNVDWNDTFTGGLVAGKEVEITANVMLIKSAQ